MAWVQFRLLTVALELETDATAGKGIVQRLGASRLKLMETQYLWIQRILYNKKATIRKIPRADNASDLGTHACTAGEIENHMRTLGYVTLAGDSKLALKAAL